MVNYNNSVIYKISCKDESITDTYIGATTCFARRKLQHKQYSNKEYPNDKKNNYKIYKFIRENGTWDNWEMNVIEEYHCDCKKDLDERERDYIKKCKPTLNKVIPLRTKKEYNKDNKEKMAKQQKIRNKRYQEQNKDKIAKQKKQYVEDNKDKIKQYKKEYQQKNRELLSKKSKIYREQNKEIIKERKRNFYQKNKDKLVKYQKEYNQKNKEKIAERDREYYKQNKEKIAEQQKIKKKCPKCDKIMRKDSIPRHLRNSCKGKVSVPI